VHPPCTGHDVTQRSMDRSCQGVARPAVTFTLQEGRGSGVGRWRQRGSGQARFLHGCYTVVTRFLHGQARFLHMHVGPSASRHPAGAEEPAGRRHASRVPHHRRRLAGVRHASTALSSGSESFCCIRWAGPHFLELVRRRGPHGHAATPTLLCAIPSTD
jgi:hypothetical protein